MNDDFRPNWASPPGDTIADILHEKKLSVTEFASRINQPVQVVNDLLQGRATITIRLSRALSGVLGGTPAFWVTRDSQYRGDSEPDDASVKGWLKQLPIGDMIRYGWLKPAPRAYEELEALLSFFDVPSVSAWEHIYGRYAELAAFRTSPTFESSPAAVAVWLRQGEREAEKVESKPWNPERFRASLEEMRRLTLQRDPQKFLHRLGEISSACGVAVIALRAPSGCRASGATKFLSDTKALLLLSFRFLSDDQFWFTFFHEVGHLLLHGKNATFIEGVDVDDSKPEREANEFAESVLIPNLYKNELLRLPNDLRAIMRFAKQIGTSPGIVVGQLQHYGRVRRNYFNSLKRRYEWSSTDEA